jgi:hypothetical protein
MTKQGIAMDQDESPLLRIPAEIRLLIYEHLFDDRGHRTLSIRNRSRLATKQDGLRRTSYRVIEQSLHRLSFETTYCLQTDVNLDLSVMSANRQIYRETSYLLYGQHSFDFRDDIEAIVPFLQDRTLASRRLIQEVSVYKRPMHSYDSGKYEWTKMCKYLGDMGTLKRLHLTVEGGRPKVEWNGPKELLVSDLRLLWQVKHDSMDWVSDLTQARGIEEVEIIPEYRYIAPPKTTAMLLYAAFSESITTSLVDFLRHDLQIAATSRTHVCNPPVPDKVAEWLYEPGTP